MPREVFERSIEEINARITAMGAATVDALQKAMYAFCERDLDLAKKIKKADAQIDIQQIEIDDLVATTMATQQPVAKDLRLLLCAIQMASDLERGADYAAHLAKATKFFAQEPQWRQTEMLEQMANIGASMITGTVNAFIERNALVARQTSLMDDQIDHLHKSVIKEMVVLLSARPDDAEKVAKFIQVSGYLERLGDHMTNTCESILYMVEGIHVELNI
ncbi:MAG: phosphate signaling complex protein PhoU [Rectinema sp.]